MFVIKIFGAQCLYLPKYTYHVHPVQFHVKFAMYELIKLFEWINVPVSW